MEQDEMEQLLSEHHRKYRMKDHPFTVLEWLICGRLLLLFLLFLWAECLGLRDMARWLF
jgi:hypothetical protein